LAARLTVRLCNLAPRAAFSIAAGFAAVLGLARVATAHEIELASIETARSVLGTRDEFVARLSPFDRAARMKSAAAVSEPEYLAFATAAAREWSNDERVRLASAFAAIEPKLAELLPELDEPILLVKTSGEEEGGAGYTRANAVMLPQAHADERELQRLLAHETFHVATRANPGLKRALYQAIGFEECGEVVLPPALAVRKMTNPDAPVNEHCIELTVDGAKVSGMPLLLSREERFDPAAGRAFFEYLTLSMLLVERTGAAARPLERDGAPVLVPMNRVTGFLEQVGRNTNYIIHAEEILASNFELLVMGTENAPSPEVLARIRAELTRAASADPR
jgi:hypothetical protein